MAGRGTSLGSNGRSANASPESLQGDPDVRLDGQLVDSSGASMRSGAPQGTTEVGSVHESQGNSDALTGAFNVIEGLIKDGRRPYGHPDDPAWIEDKEGMLLLCGRQLPDRIRPREVPSIKLTPVEGGWLAVLTDYTTSYACTWRFSHLDQFFASWSIARGRRENWKEVKIGEGHQKRQAEIRKELDKAKGIR